MRLGWLMSWFLAWQQISTMSSYVRKILFDSQVLRMNCQTFSTGLSSGDRGGSGRMVILGGAESFGLVCHAA